MQTFQIRKQILDELKQIIPSNVLSLSNDEFIINFEGIKQFNIESICFNSESFLAYLDYLVDDIDYFYFEDKSINQIEYVKSLNFIFDIALFEHSDLKFIDLN